MKFSCYPVDLVFTGRVDVQHAWTSTHYWDGTVDLPSIKCGSRLCNYLGR